jgi:hypothetical protein
MKDSWTIVHNLRTQGVALRGIVQPVHSTAMRRLPRQEKLVRAEPIAMRLGIVYRVLGKAAA